MNRGVTKSANHRDLQRFLWLVALAAECAIWLGVGITAALAGIVLEHRLHIALFEGTNLFLVLALGLMLLANIFRVLTGAGDQKVTPFIRWTGYSLLLVVWVPALGCA